MINKRIQSNSTYFCWPADGCSRPITRSTGLGKSMLQNRIGPMVNFRKNMSIAITLSFNGDELKYHSINDTNKQKKPNYADYTAKMDWQPHPFPNSARFNQVQVRSLGKNEMEILEMKDGDVLVSAIYQLMPGGKRFVRRGIAKGADGKSDEYEEFFDKQ